MNPYRDERTNPLPVVVNNLNGNDNNNNNNLIELPGFGNAVISYAPPQVTGIVPKTGPTTNIKVNITGTNFGIGFGENKVTIGTYQCEILNYFYLTDNGGTSIIEVLLKEGQGSDLDVIVTIGGQNSSAQLHFHTKFQQL